jgi:hypothetical protein
VAVEVDHLFVLVAAGGPEASRLIAAGLTEGPPNVHPGQGTANRRFFFDDAMLELLWVADPAETEAGPARATGLVERWRGRATGACPFGIAVRPRPGTPPEAPFAGWRYAPPYLPPPAWILVADSCRELREPFLFYVPVGDPPVHLRVGAPVRHRAGIRRLTAVRLESATDCQPGTRAALAAADVAVARGPADLLRLGFDGERAGQRADLRPDLPLVLTW